MNNHIFRDGAPINTDLNMVRFKKEFLKFARKNMSRKELAVINDFMRTGYLAKYQSPDMVVVITRGADVQELSIRVPSKFLVEDTDQDFSEKTFEGLRKFKMDACGKGVCVASFNHFGPCYV